MSSDPFPEHPDANKLFARNGVINAALPIARLQRLQASLAGTGQTDTAVMVQLTFGHDDEGRRRLVGKLDAAIQLLCQRCLQPLQQQLHCNLDVLILDSEAALKALPAADAVAIDVIVDETGELDVLALIEDELLLSLPLVPLHEDPHCSSALDLVRRKSGQEDELDAQGANRRQNPFAVLAALKQDPKQDKN